MENEKQADLGDVSELPIQSKKKIGHAELERLYWQEAKSLHQIAKITGYTHTTIRRWMIERGIPRRSRYESVAKRPNLENRGNLCYVIGVLLGDGYVSTYKDGRGIVGLDQTRGEFANAFEASLKEMGLNPCKWERNYYGKRKNMWIVTASSAPFFRWWKSLILEDIEGIVGEDTKYKIALIRGFFESEGSNIIHQKGWTIDFNNTKKNVLELVHSFLTDLGFKFKMGSYQRAERRICYYLRQHRQTLNYKFIEMIKPCIKNRTIEPAEQIIIGEEGVKKELIRYAKILNTSPSSVQVPRKLVNAASHHYGSWNKAKITAGLNIKLPYQTRKKVKA